MRAGWIALVAATLVLGGAICPGGRALAADEAALERCRALKTASARLGCYDSLLPPTADGAESAPAAPAVSQTPKSLATGKWSVRTETSKMADTWDVFLTLGSENLVKCRSFGGRSEMRLVLRCMENTTSAFMVGDCHFASGFQGYGRVTYRVDKKKARTVSMDASTDNEALGLWRGRTAIPFIKQLIGGETLLMRATPFNESPIEVEFDIRGLEEAVKPLRESCGW